MATVIKLKSPAGRVRWQFVPGEPIDFNAARGDLALRNHLVRACGWIEQANQSDELRIVGPSQRIGSIVIEFDKEVA